MRTEEEYLKLENQLLKKEIEILKLKQKEKERAAEVTFNPSHIPGVIDPSAFPININPSYSYPVYAPWRGWTDS